MNINILKLIKVVTLSMLLLLVSNIIYAQEQTTNPDAADINLEDCTIPVFATSDGVVKSILIAQGKMKARSRDGEQEQFLGWVDVVKLRTYNPTTKASADYPVMYFSSLKLSPKQQSGQESIQQGELVGCAKDQMVEHGTSLFFPTN